ncbi:MAG: hypothetical protein GX844_02565 [Alcaligenaceae bacterium]|jgi:sigma-E factor negative regulatory protein RseB|nr:hypothetical protein [Alcaligenaceae bacterium]
MIKLLHKPLLGISAFVLSFVVSTMSYAQTAPEVEELNLEQLLNQIQLASTQNNYQGVFVSHWANQNLVSSRITNVYHNGQLTRRVESLDGSPIEVLRTDDQQIQLHPEQKVVVSTPIRSHDFPGILLKKSTGITDYYFAQELDATTRVAGIDCKKIIIEPKDLQRYGFRLCVEPIKRLLLQIETIDPKQQIVSQTTFTQLSFDEQLATSSIESEHDYTGWTHFKPQFNELDLEAEGWEFFLPSGFQKVTSFNLGIGTKKEVKQLTFSDGLSSFSLFIQELDQQDTKRYGHTDQVEGAVNIYSRRLGTYWLTVLGAMPLATLKTVAESTKNNSMTD